MAIEKGLYGMPEGIDEELVGEMGEPDAMIEMAIATDEDMPVMVELEDGSVEISFGEENEDIDMAPFDANLAEYLEDNQLQEISGDLEEAIDGDTAARRDWADSYVAGLDVLGMKYEERTEPWENACGVYSNILAEAAIRFQAEAMSETFPAAGPVKTKILGEATREKEDAALRVKTDMNYELTEVMVEYRPEHERLLYSLGLAGSAFKKVYYDPNMGRQTALYIPAEDVIVPYGASNIESAERVTHVMRKTKNEVVKLQAAGFYREIELGDPVSFFTDIEEAKAEQSGISLTSDDRYTILEVHADLIIDGVDTEGEDDDLQIAKPYVVTLEKGTGKILAIRRNWNIDDPLMLKRQHFVHYAYVPDLDFMDSASFILLVVMLKLALVLSVNSWTLEPYPISPVVSNLADYELRATTHRLVRANSVM